MKFQPAGWNVKKRQSCRSSVARPIDRRVKEATLPLTELHSGTKFQGAAKQVDCEERRAGFTSPAHSAAGSLPERFCFHVVDKTLNSHVDSC